MGILRGNLNFFEVFGGNLKFLFEPCQGGILRVKWRKWRRNPENIEQMQGGTRVFFVDFCFERPIPLPPVNNDRSYDHRH